jgi:hypothetical protein
MPAARRAWRVDLGERQTAEATLAGGPGQPEPPARRAAPPGAPERRVAPAQRVPRAPPVVRPEVPVPRAPPRGTPARGPAAAEEGAPEAAATLEWPEARAVAPEEQRRPTPRPTAAPRTARTAAAMPPLTDREPTPTDREPAEMDRQTAAMRRRGPMSRPAGSATSTATERQTARRPVRVRETCPSSRGSAAAPIPAHRS